METLTGTSVNAALWDLTVALGARRWRWRAWRPTPRTARARIAEALESGAAAEIFGRMVAAQGGPADFVERWPDRLPSAPVVLRGAGAARWLCRPHRRRGLGHAVVHLGGGRLREGDKVNPSVGLSDLAGMGEETGAGVPLPWSTPQPKTRRGRRCVRCRRPMHRAEVAPDEPALVQKRIA